MSKKRTGLLIAFGAALGAAAAGISYYLKYKSFNDELEKDFHDYEEEEPASEEKKEEPIPCTDTAGRNYITLDHTKGKDSEKEAPVREAAPAENAEPAKEEAPAPTAAVTVEEDTDGANA